MRSKVFSGLCIGFLGTLATGLVSADAVTQYTSLASWDSAVSDVTSYTILQPPNVSDGVVLPPLGLYPFNGDTGETIGPARFRTPGNLGIIFDDGAFGPGVQYVAASPQAFPSASPATVDVTFSASSNITALAFSVGTVDYFANIVVSVNGTALTPFEFSFGNPPIFLGLTDTSPITDISFTTVNAQYGGGNTNFDPGEIDVIGSYSTAKAVAVAPEIDPASATGALTLLFGGLAVLRARKRA